MPELGLQILVGVITAVLAVAIFSLWKTVVLRPVKRLGRWAMRLRCEVFEKHSMRFLIGSGDESGGKWRYSCKNCRHTEIERW